ncbi:MAG: TIR domain-containing protein [Candidatus Entotheonellia bacterium]
MKVFISWSGARSQVVAEKFRDWLPDVIQAVAPWISSEDIRKGKRWSVDLAHQLETTHIGVICLTPGNLTAPWLLFEAGALSKLHTKKGTYVCTYLIGVSHTTVTGPLAEFQHTLATKADTHQLVKTINAAMEQGRITDTQLDRAFERCWPDLQQCLETLPETKEAVPPPRKAEDMLQEILEIVRGIAGSISFSREPNQRSREQEALLARTGSLAEAGRWMLKEGRPRSPNDRQ